MTDDDIKTEDDNQQATQQENDSMEVIANTMLEIAWKDFATSADDKRVLDTKANMILVASGVLLGLIINGNKIMDTSFSLLAGGLLIGSSICCILALGIRSYSALGTMKTWNALKCENLLYNPLKAKLNIMATLDKAVEDNRTQARNIVTMIRPANYLFIAALIMISLAVLLHYAASLSSCPGIT